MQQEQKDILNTQLNTGNNHNSDSSSLEEKIFKTKRIEKSPFTILHREDKYYLTVGNNLMSMAYDTEKEVLEHIENNKWDVITTLILLLIDKMQEEQVIEMKAIMKKEQELMARG